MKKSVLLVFVFGFSFWGCFSQTPGEWTWMSGVKGGSAPVWGVQGVPGVNNQPPALYEACQWTDLQGNFWLFGGVDGSTLFNYGDLWKYDPTSNMWTWISGTGISNAPSVYGTKGVPSSTNQPGSRGYNSYSWIDLSGDLWFFGGANGGTFNDLWRYNISTNIWTWESGTNTANSLASYGVKGIPSVNNYPECVSESATSWIDNSGNLWLYSKSGNLWKYNISTNEWTWMQGDSTGAQTAVYGTKGLSSSLNTPGARWSYSHWKDKSDNLWLFGGGGVTTNLNDLWKYNVNNNEWTWMSGTNVQNDQGTYGLLCGNSTNDLPAARFENKTCWTDKCGNFWMLGGFVGVYGTRNDLWQYNPIKNVWVWVSGAGIINQLGNYGTKGISSPSNMPAGRGGSSTWIQSNGDLWLYGGLDSNYYALSDLWRYVSDPSCGGCVQSSLPKANFISSDTAFCDEPMKCISFSDFSIGNPTSWQWHFPGGTPNTSSQQNPTNICYSAPGTYPVTLIVANSSGTDSLTVSPMITVGGMPPPPTITKVGDTLYSSHGSSYQWYKDGVLIAGAIDSFYVTNQGGVYSVRITDGFGCNSLSAGFTVGVQELSGGGGLEIYPNPAGDQFEVRGLTPNPSPKERGDGATIEIYNVFGEKVYSTQIGDGNKKQETINCKKFSPGIYFVRVSNGKEIFSAKFVKE